MAAAIPGFERMVGRLAIPNVCAGGTVVGIKFRDITGTDGLKYDQPTGQVARLFNLNALNVGGDAIAITEGELDAISLGTLDVPAVAVPGASGWKKHHWRLFEGYQRVIVYYDQDSAGREMLKTLIATSLPVLPVVVPGGHNDVNAALCGGEAAALKALFTGGG